jgi:hypothetical protein
MNNILVEVDYKKYQWKVCADFKVIAVLLGLQAMLGDYCWMIKRDVSETKYHRRAKRTRR